LNSAISDVLPGILRLKYLWERMVVEAEQQELIYFLIHNLNKKFEYELSSPVYQVNIDGYKLFLHILFYIGLFLR